MKTRYIRFGLILMGAFLVDLVSKYWGEGQTSFHQNQGFIMGYFSGQPESIRIVALSFFAAILFTLYLVVMYLAPKRAGVFKLALSLVMGGLFGNVFDKIAYGYTRDFIPFSLGNFAFVFNLADVFLWSGAVIIFWIVVKKDHLLWHEDSNRKRYLIHLSEQLGFAFQLTLIVFNSCLMLGIFSFSYLSISVPQSSQGLIPFALTLGSITVFVCLLSFLGGIIMSHRRLGALYAFELFVNDLLSGKDRNFRMREADNYRHLEATAEKLRNHFQNKNNSNKP